jgi:hypothetical protein
MNRPKKMSLDAMIDPILSDEKVSNVVVHKYDKTIQENVNDTKIK